MTSPAPSLRDRFIGGMSHAACTVNIVTTDGDAGRAGVTVSAMSSVSADTPNPTLLVCVHHLSPAVEKIIENGIFCVNVLKDDQAYISDTFAGRFKGQVTDKFECADWADMPTGAPRVVDPLVAFDCTVLSSSLIGTHYVIFGEVSDIFNAGRGSPLIYANRAYGAAARIDTAESIGAGKSAANNRLSIGCFHTFGPFVLPELLRRMIDGNPALKINLVEGDQGRVQESLRAGETELALLYDINLPDDLTITPLTELTPYVLLAEDHPLAGRDELTPADLADHPMILLNAPPSRDYFTGIFRTAGVSPNIALRSTNMEMVRGLVGQGVGYTLLATKPASSMTYDGRALTSCRLSSETGASRIVLASKKGGQLSEPADQFRTFCLEKFDFDD